MKTVTKLCALAFSVGSIPIISSAVHARPAYVGRVPSTLSCSTCHIDNQPKSVRNSFGIDFLQAGLSWEPICNNDSDMDSFSNGIELNDPNCTWVRGAPPPAGPQSNPGDAGSIPLVEPPEPTCNDQIQNGDESDVDCGGPDCPACPDSSMCMVASDCAEASDCIGGICQATAMAGEMVMAGEMAGGMVMAGEMAGEMVIAGEPANAGDMQEEAGEMADSTGNSASQDDGGCMTNSKDSSNSISLILFLLLLGVRRYQMPKETPNHLS